MALFSLASLLELRKTLLDSIPALNSASRKKMIRKKIMENLKLFGVASHQEIETLKARLNQLELELKLAKKDSSKE